MGINPHHTETAWEFLFEFVGMGRIWIWSIISNLRVCGWGEECQVVAGDFLRMTEHKEFSRSESEQPSSNSFIHFISTWKQPNIFIFALNHLK